MTPMPTTADYLIWPNLNPVDFACILGDFTGFKDIYSIWQGKSVQADFPPDAEFAMSPEFPDNTILTDHLMNRYNLIVGSERLKMFLEERKVAPVEYLKVAIRDHKGKTAAHYYIVNPLDAIDCLDYEASGAVTSRALKTQVLRAKRTVLIPGRLIPERQFFRIANYPAGRLVRRDLANAMLAAGLSGIQFQELG